VIFLNEPPNHWFFILKTRPKSHFFGSKTQFLASKAVFRTKNTLKTGIYL
jgi:hypothetical protein